MSVLLTVNITTQHGAVLIIFPLNLQTITITPMFLAEGRGTAGTDNPSVRAKMSTTNQPA